MTRDEKMLIEAAQHSDYVGAVCGLSEETIKFVKGAFIYGVIWADENPANVWHNASEEPTAYQWEILYEDNSEMWWVANHFDAAGDWKSFASDEFLVRWAYINDLLPKKEVMYEND